MKVPEAEQTHISNILKLIELAHELHASEYPLLLVDALAYYLVASDQEPTKAIERLNKSFSTISAAHAVVHHGAGRA